MKKQIISIVVMAILGTTNVTVASSWYWGWTPSSINWVSKKTSEQPKKSPPQQTELLELIKKMHDSITENRELGTKSKNYDSFFLKNPATIYNKNKDKNKDLDISASVEKILQEEEVSNSINEARKSIEARSQYAMAADKALSLHAFQQTDDRSKEILSLKDNINKTKDLKGIAELQAYIKSELAMIQNETVKLQLVAHLRNAERELISQKKYKRNMKILNSENKGMPTIRSIR
ncbi:type IV secretion system protein [Bartonella jaculi]|uniref:Uncharacterized protein n=1 Tax=Bartonella jaculi TaxID=686226 RepID=A0ABP9N556_9HYPH